MGNKSYSGLYLGLSGLLFRTRRALTRRTDAATVGPDVRTQTKGAALMTTIAIARPRLHGTATRS